jgi:chemotaxis protein histidine kinase CheA
MVAEHLGGTLALDTEYKQGAKFDMTIPFTPQA